MSFHRYSTGALLLGTTLFHAILAISCLIFWFFFKNDIPHFSIHIIQSILGITMPITFCCSVLCKIRFFDRLSECLVDDIDSSEPLGYYYLSAVILSHLLILAIILSLIISDVYLKFLKEPLLFAIYATLFSLFIEVAIACYILSYFKNFLSIITDNLKEIITGVKNGCLAFGTIQILFFCLFLVHNG